jgi:hypothetical protein
MLPLYPVSAGISYPSAKEVLTFLTKSKITETQFTEEHVEMLLNVLVLDGDIERVRWCLRCSCIYMIENIFYDCSFLPLAPQCGRTTAAVMKGLMTLPLRPQLGETTAAERGRNGRTRERQ